MSRLALLALLLAAASSPVRAFGLSLYYARASEQAREQEQARLARGVPLPRTLTLRLSVASVASPTTAFGARFGDDRRISDVPRLSRNRDWLEDMQKAPHDIRLQLHLSDPARPGRYEGIVLTAGRAARAHAQVIFHGEPAGLLELQLSWRAATGLVQSRTYFQFDDRGGIAPVRFRDPGFRSPERLDVLDVTADVRVDGGYEQRDYPVSLAEARIVSLEAGR